MRLITLWLTQPRFRVLYQLYEKSHLVYKTVIKSIKVEHYLLELMLSSVDKVRALGNFGALSRTEICCWVCRPDRCRPACHWQLQGVPTSLELVKSNVQMLRNLRAKRAMFRKKNILLQKITFLAFFVNCKNENGIFKQLCSNCLM